MPPRSDLQLEPLVEILEGKRYVHAHCYIASEILMLINLADEFGFKSKLFSTCSKATRSQKRSQPTVQAPRSLPTHGATRSKLMTRFLTTLPS